MGSLDFIVKHEEDAMSELNQKLADAVSKLDLANDNHWTADGLPRVETLRLVAGEPSITRDNVTAALPSVTRQSLQTAQAAAAVGASTGTDAPEENAPAADLPPATVVIAAAGTSTLDEAFTPTEIQEATDGNLREVLSLAKEKLAELASMKAQVDRAHSEQSAEVDRLQLLTEAEDVQNGQDPVREYLNSRQRVYEQRAERQKALVEAGLNLGAISKLANPQSVLDQQLRARGRTPR